MSSRVYLSIRYFTIKTKEAVCIEYNEFLFQHEYLHEGRGAVRREKETRYIQYGQLLLFQ